MSEAERIVNALTNRPEAKDADGDYNFVLDRQQMIDIVEKQLRLAREPQWVSVEDRLPEVGQECAVNIHNGDRYYRRWGIYGGDGCWSGDGGFQMCMQYPDRIQNVTHWMPLPAPPKPQQ